MKYVTRAFAVAFTIGLVAAVGLMLLTAARVGALPGSGSVTTELLSLTFYTAQRELLPDGSAVSLEPGFGTAVLVVVFPAVTTLLAWHRRVRGGAEAVGH